MPFCNAVNFAGNACGKNATDQSYFWYYDQYERVNRVFRLCQEHSNKIIFEVMGKETGMTQLIDKLYKKIESLRAEKTKGHNLNEEREAIKNAKENGLPRPSFRKLEIIEAEIKENFRKIKVYKDLRNIERNKTCRACGYPLKEPNDVHDQMGAKFSHADFHSGFGYRREVMMFHTECGITWLMHVVSLKEKELKYVRPKLTGQGVLFNEL